jgi:hypothetical protein
MKNESTQENSAEKNSEIAKVFDKKRRGRPFRNANTHELLSNEFIKTTSNAKKLTAQEKKTKKALAETMLVQGFSITEISQALSVAKSNVCYWRDHLDDEKKAKIEQTVLNSVSARMSDFLNASYQSMAQLAHYCSTKEFVMSHSPEQIARLIDVLANQAFALIEAKQRADLAKMSASEQSSMKS